MTIDMTQQPPAERREPIEDVRRLLATAPRGREPEYPPATGAEVGGRGGADRPAPRDVARDSPRQG